MLNRAFIQICCFPVLKSIPKRQTDASHLPSFTSTSHSPPSLHLLPQHFDWLSDHHIHSDFLVGARKPDLLSHAVTHLPIDLDIDVMRAFEIARLSSLISLY